jgi:predicted dehydrogenase
LGPVVSVDAQMDFVDLSAGRTDASFTITLRHESGAHAHVSASKLNHIDAREFRAYGDLGCYISNTTDVQAQSIFAGRRPVDDLATWGYEPKANWGTLFTATGAQRIPSEQGRYHDYYEAFERAVRTGSPPPVTAEAGAQVLAVLDAARQSANDGRSIAI